MLVLVALVSVFALPLSAAPPSHKNKFSEIGTWQTHTCRDGQNNAVGTVGASGAEKLWPPNHKFPATPNKFIGDASDNDDGTFLETFLHVVDATGGDGGSNHDPDASPLNDTHSDPAGDEDPDVDSDADSDGGSDEAVDPAGADPNESGDSDTEGTSTTEHALRAERSGRGEGRLYRVEWRATFDDNNNTNGYTMVICGSTGVEVAQGVPGTFSPFYICVPHDMRPAYRGPDCEPPPPVA